METATFTSERGRKWTVKILRKGDRYGLKDCLVWGDDRLVIEFYDSNQDPAKFEPLGQFVTRYYLCSLLEIAAGVGLDLMTYEPAWKIDGPTLDRIMKWIKEQV